MTGLPDRTASRGLAAAIAKEAARTDDAFYTLRTFAPPRADAPWETFGGALVADAFRPLFFVSDHGVMRTASVLVRPERGNGAHDRFETPRGPLLPPALGALVAASARTLDHRPTVLDAACMILEAVHGHGVRLELLGRWEGTLGARFDAGTASARIGPLAFAWQRPEGLELGLASRGASGRISVPTRFEAVPTLPDLCARLPAITAALLELCPKLG